MPGGAGRERDDGGRGQVTSLKRPHTHLCFLSLPAEGGIKGGWDGVIWGPSVPWPGRLRVLAVAQAPRRCGAGSPGNVQPGGPRGTAAATAGRWSPSPHPGCCLIPDPSPAPLGSPWNLPFAEKPGNAEPLSQLPWEGLRGPGRRSWLPQKLLKVPAPSWPRFAEGFLGRRRWEDSPEGVPLAGLCAPGRGHKANFPFQGLHCSRDARPCLPQWALDYAEDSARCAHSSAHWAEGKELRFRIRQQPETPWGLKRPQSSLNSLKEQLERKAWGRG